MALFGKSNASDDTPNYYKEAFLSQYNIITLAGLGLFALMGGGVAALMVGAGLELLYMVTVPENKRFQRLVNSRRNAEQRQARKKSLQDMFKTLSHAERRKYNELRQLTFIIRKNYENLGSVSQSMLQNSLNKLDSLMDSYLRLLLLQDQLVEYLRHTDANKIQNDIDKLSTDIEDASPRIKEIQQRRIGILKKRLERVEKAHEHYKIVQAQLLTIEDVLKLVRDQSYTMKDPSEISDQLDSLMFDVESTEETVKEMESFLDMADSFDLEEPAGGRRRVRN